MSTLEPINLHERVRQSEYYDRSRDIETALAWSSIRKTLTDAGREDIFHEIKSIRITDKTIVITTMKPIVNAEISHYRESIVENLNASWKKMSIPPRAKVRLV